MPHLVLVGDSIFDNGAYVSEGSDVCAQVVQLLPGNWRASSCAVDGSTCDDVQKQLLRIPSDSTHVALSVGGNDALRREYILHASVTSSVEALLLLADAIDDFEVSYRKCVDGVIELGLPVTVCTIYNGNFADRDFQRCVRVAIAAYNDVITRVAAENKIAVIDLRRICMDAMDYANAIEPSVIGGAKIAGAIVSAVGTGNLA